MIQWGKQDIVFAGGGEELDWSLSCVLFDAMSAMSSNVMTHRPAPAALMTKTATALRIPPAVRVLVLEEMEHAKKRGAKIYAEIVGYG